MRPVKWPSRLAGVGVVAQGAEEAAGWMLLHSCKPCVGRRSAWVDGSTKHGNYPRGWPQLVPHISYQQSTLFLLRATALLSQCCLCLSSTEPWPLWQTIITQIYDSAVVPNSFGSHWQIMSLGRWCCQKTAHKFVPAWRDVYFLSACALWMWFLGWDSKSLHQPGLWSMSGPAPGVSPRRPTLQLKSSSVSWESWQTSSQSSTPMSKLQAPGKAAMWPERERFTLKV